MARDRPDLARRSDLARVAVVGTSCSGKTTFASELARRLDAPHVELDALFWLPDWQMRGAAEFRSLTREYVAQNAWVVDGNYAPVRDFVWQRATTVVWLDYPLSVVFWRGLARSLRRVFRREMIFSGNRETFGMLFSRESILLWLLTSYPRHRRDYGALFRDNRHKTIRLLRFRQPSEASAFLRTIECRVDPSFESK